jgi:hypothetical protein
LASMGGSFFLRGVVHGARPFDPLLYALASDARRCPVGSMEGVGAAI